MITNGPIIIVALIALSFFWVRGMIPKDGFVVQFTLTLALWGCILAAWAFIFMPFIGVPISRIFFPS